MLIVGGVEIPAEKGLAGHSDGDVLCHAVMDALLGSVGLPDIGYWFPDSDPQYSGVRSTGLVSRIGSILREKKWQIINIDTTLIAEYPRFAPYRELMGKNLAGALKIDCDRIGIKATTHEGIGSLGRGEGIACVAVSLVRRKW